MPEFTRAQQVASFMSKVKIPENPDDCWVWTACTYNCGYGSFKWKGKMVGANRVSWEIANGQDIPEGMDVLHACDNPICVNPLHLRVGTHTENMIEMRKKLRCAKQYLTPDQVLEVRAALKENPARGIGTKLARKYGVPSGVISKIKVGKSYQWLKDEEEVSA